MFSVATLSTLDNRLHWLIAVRTFESSHGDKLSATRYERER